MRKLDCHKVSTGIVMPLALVDIPKELFGICRGLLRITKVTYVQTCPRRKKSPALLVPEPVSFEFRNGKAHAIGKRTPTIAAFKKFVQAASHVCKYRVQRFWTPEAGFLYTCKQPATTSRALGPPQWATQKQARQFTAALYLAGVAKQSQRTVCRAGWRCDSPWFLLDVPFDAPKFFDATFRNLDTHFSNQEIHQSVRLNDRQRNILVGVRIASDSFAPHRNVNNLLQPNWRLESEAKNGWIVNRSQTIKNKRK